MPKVTGWQCLHCKVIRPSESRMIQCENKCLKRKLEKEEMKRYQKAVKSIGDVLRMNADSVSDVRKWIPRVVHSRLGRVVKIETWNYGFRMLGSVPGPINKNPKFCSGADYPGWKIRAAGKCTFATTPARLHGSRCLIRSMQDLFVENDACYIRGVSVTNSYRSENNFNIELMMYMEDFPKIVERFLDWKNIYKQAIKAKSMEDELYHGAENKFIKQDPEILSAREKIEIMNMAKDNALKFITARTNELRDSPEYLQAKILPSEYQFDRDKYESMDYEFGGYVDEC